MNKTFNALLLSGIILFVFEVMGSSVSSQRETLKNFEGEWVLEQAEYVVRIPHAQGDSIVSKIYFDNFELITSCANQVPKRIIAEGDIVQVETSFDFYLGRASWESISGRYFLSIGIDEDLGKETPIPGLYFNISNLNYLVEILDNKTIVLETKTLCEKDSVKEEGVIKCLLRKNK